MRTKGFGHRDQNPLSCARGQHATCEFHFYVFKKRKLLTSPAQPATPSRGLGLSGNATVAAAHRGESDTKMLPGRLTGPRVSLWASASFGEQP